VTRYTADGDRDGGFGNGGTTTAWGRVTADPPGGGLNGPAQVAYAVAVGPGGKVVAAGQVPANNGDFAVARWNSDGTVDTSFGTKKSGNVSTDIGKRTSDKAMAVAVQADEKIVACGASSGKTALVRYTAAGALDTSFGNGGKVVGGTASGWMKCIRILPSGLILVACNKSSGGSVAAFNSSGGLVFNRPILGFVSDVQPLADGKILVGGNDDPNNEFGPYAQVARLNADGSLDTSFGASGIADLDLLVTHYTALAVQPDGKIVYANQGATARLHPDGDYDPTFGVGGIAPSPGADSGSGSQGVAIAADGGIVRQAQGGPGNTSEIFLWKHLPDDSLLLTVPDPVGEGDELALGLAPIHPLNGTILDVEFFVDIDGDGALDDEIDLGPGVLNGGVWETSGTVDWPADLYTYFAVVGYAAGYTVVATQGLVVP
jgi:uncharacterized delta-60 repeat protein